MTSPLVEASIQVARALSQTLVPLTPTRAHYYFGYGDLVRAFRGVLLYNPATKTDTNPKVLLVRCVFVGLLSPILIATI